MDAHPITRRWFAEDLVRLRRADEERRYLASQRAGRVDPNPHQIDAVIFALERIPRGGCILADEVGLGKTIEAGLVIAQLLAEGARRVLLITPKPLLGQWRQELATLFDLDAREGAEDGGFAGAGVFLVGRELAGSERGAAMLRASGGFDLAIIDEAHEIFAGIWRRYDRAGSLTASRYAKTAARVKSVLEGTPVLLLTATPIQNTLTELWGLVQYVEPTGTLLGDLPTFRTLFCEDGDRSLRAGQDEELRRRIAEVCQRTLRRQAQEFMERKFVGRSARVFEYSMSAEERALYDDVTAYLLTPDACAFQGGHRKLLLLSFHRRMASSVRALADSLAAVAERLEERLRGADAATLSLFSDDLEDEEPALPDAWTPPPAPLERCRLELERVRALAERARDLPTDTKAAKLIEAVRFVLRRAAEGQGSGKVVIFTEALSTQAYLREVLVQSGLVREDEITSFSGRNAGPGLERALGRWRADVGDRLPPSARPSPAVAGRLALVHEFAVASRVFLSTEAGAKGLNLQFCENVINYDLPWNPQRIEQRIGRCHRYGQERDVLVINFLARENEAQRLTFDILSRKLELFGSVLDASDVVLHRATGPTDAALVSTLGGEMEAGLWAVYEQARDAGELARGLQALGETLNASRQALEETQARTASLIEARLDVSVRSTFARLEASTRTGLAALDRQLEAVVTRYLSAMGVAHRRDEADGEVRLAVAPDPGHPPGLERGATFVIGRGAARPEAEVLHVGHPVVQAAVQEARSATRSRLRARARERREGGVARVTVLRVTYGGYEPVVALVPVVWQAGEEAPWDADRARALLEGALVPARAPGWVGAIEEAAMCDAVEEALFLARAEVDAREQARFDDAIARLERFMDDRVMVLARSRQAVAERRAEAQRRRDLAAGAAQRQHAQAECEALEREEEGLLAEIERLQRREDDDYQLWRAQAFARRYTPPTCERILEAEIELG